VNQPEKSPPPEGRSRFDKALQDIEELKAKLQRNEARGKALVEKLKAAFQTIERTEAKFASIRTDREAP